MEHTIRALRPEERMLAFLRDDRGMQESGYIGNLRVDKGTHGTDFFPVWDCFDEKLNGKAFQAEFGEVVNALRHDPSFNGILHDRKSMARLCQKVPDSRMSLNANEFGFRMDTADRTYILRLNPPKGRYAAHIYVYDRETLERYMEPILARRKEMKVLLVEPEKRPEVRQIGCDLDSLQQCVQGWIEAVYPFDDPVAIICNEEGKMNGLQLNRALYDENGRVYDIIAGTFIVAGVTKDDFGSLSEELIRKYEERFHDPERFAWIGRRVLVEKMDVRESVKDKLKEKSAVSIREDGSENVMEEVR